jgi:hypothetical protein
MPLSLLNHSALALFAQRTRIPTSARSIGFCVIWVCISSSSSACIPGGIKNPKNQHNENSGIDQRSLMFYATTTKNCLPRIFVRLSVRHITFLSGYICSDTLRMF